MLAGSNLDACLNATEVSATETEKWKSIKQGLVHRYLWSFKYTIFDQKLFNRGYYYLDTHPGHMSKIL